eukprot:scaffold48_cov311-Pinguiococcus_pyrenoidosus.AAC.160
MPMHFRNAPYDLLQHADFLRRRRHDLMRPALGRQSAPPSVALTASSALRCPCQESYFRYFSAKLNPVSDRFAARIVP